MNVYLLLIDDERFFFYSAEDPEEGAGKEKAGGLDATSDGGWTSRLAAGLTGRLGRVKDAWRHAEGGMLGKVREWWEWLHTFIHPQESLLVRLYWARRIDLHYPASRSAEVRAIWRDYLRGRFWHHLLWLAINAAIVPPVAVLALLPGPNFIGYWFTYRAIHHGLIVLGIRRARREKVPTALIPSEGLDRPVHRDEHGAVTHPIFRGARNHHRLHVYYEWAGGTRPGPDAPSRAPAPPPPIADLKPDPTGHGDRRTAHESPELQHP